MEGHTVSREKTYFYIELYLYYPFISHRDEIQKINYTLEECQRDLAAKLQQKQIISTDLLARHQEYEMITNCSPDQCRILVMKYDTYHALQTAIQSNYDWADQVIKQHDEYFAKFDDCELVHFLGRFQGLRASAVAFDFEVIQPIFVATNHLELYDKSRELSVEMTNTVLNIGETMQQVHDILTQYKTNVLSLLPKSNASNHFLHQFRVWCEGLVGGFQAFDLSVSQCQLILNEISYGGVSAVNSAAVTTYAHNLLTAIQDLSMQHQMLSYEDKEIGELEARFQVAMEKITAGEGETERIKHLNFTVLWELHKKYQMILGSDLTKLRYEMALNSFLFFKHAKLIDDTGNEEFKKGLDGLEKCTNLFEWMNEIKYKFSEEVIPWSIQAIFTGDPHVIETITRISQCYPNGELKELDKKLSEALEVELGAGGCGGGGERPACQSVNEIKYKLAELYKSYANEKHVGAKIFKRFYELFNTLEQKFADLIEGLLTAPVEGTETSSSPADSPKKLTQVRIRDL